MMKSEFDAESVATGYGPCADYMWPEIERIYTSSDRISRELMVDIYWHEPSIMRAILERRDEAEKIARSMVQVEDYQFGDIRERQKKLSLVLEDIEYIIDAAELRRMRRKIGNESKDLINR